MEYDDEAGYDNEGTELEEQQQQQMEYQEGMEIEEQEEEDEPVTQEDAWAVIRYVCVSIRFCSSTPFL